MNVDVVVRSVFAVLFVAVLVIGAFVYRNYERLLGADPSVPTDNAGSRGLNKVQVISIWLHLLAITAAFALFG